MCITVHDCRLLFAGTWGVHFLPYSITVHDCRLLYLAGHVYACMLAAVW